MTTIPTLTLNNDSVMPQLGFGVYQIDQGATATAVAEALRVGYRSIDTAAMYRNEPGVGAALRDSGLDRGSVFVTTKLNNPDHGYDSALRAFDASLERLGLDYVDLYLIHWPQPTRNEYVETWRAFGDITRSGRAKAVGVSNFTVDHLRRLVDETGLVPAVNQIELHPYFQQPEMRAFHAGHGIATEAWAPLAKGGEVLTDPAVTAIADKHGVTAAQIVLAWHLAVGNIAIPKSVTPSRIAENFAAADVALDDDDLAAMASLDRGARIGPDPAANG